MLTLAIPPNAFTSKSGRSARVVGEPVHAAGPNSDTNASATTDDRDSLGRMVHKDIKFHALTDANNLPSVNITLALLRSLATEAKAATESDVLRHTVARWQLHVNPRVSNGFQDTCRFESEEARAGHENRPAQFGPVHRFSPCFLVLWSNITGICPAVCIDVLPSPDREKTWYWSGLGLSHSRRCFCVFPQSPQACRPSDTTVLCKKCLCTLHRAAAFKLRESYADRNLERRICG